MNKAHMYLNQHQTLAQYYTKWVAQEPWDAAILSLQY